MKKKVNKLLIEKAKRNEEEGKYILYLYSESEKGYNYRRIFRGNRQECFLEKRKLLNEDGF